MNTITINGIHLNVDQLALENESIEQLKTRDLFPEGASQADAYATLWDEVQKVKSSPAETVVAVEKVSKKKKA